MALTNEELERIAERLAQKAVDGLDTENLLLHSLSDLYGSPGIVVDEATARNSDCRCVANICFSKGIIGALDEAQREWACNPRRDLDSPALRERIEKFKGAAASCQAEIARHPKGERLKPWLECMGKELAAVRIVPSDEPSAWPAVEAQTSALPPEVEEELEELAVLPETARLVTGRPPGEGIPDTVVERILDLRDEGLDILQIAGRAGRSLNDVHRVLLFHLPEQRDRLQEERDRAERTLVRAELRREHLVTEEEAEQIHRLRAEGLTLMEIARKMGRGMTTIHRTLSHPPRAPLRRMAEEILGLAEQVFRLRAQRLPLRDIASKVGISTSYVLDLLHRAGVVLPDLDPTAQAQRLEKRLAQVADACCTSQRTVAQIEQAGRELSDIADEALLATEIIPPEVKEAEPDYWWRLGWVRHRALDVAELLKAGIACHRALEKKGPIARQLSLPTLDLPQVRASLQRCVRAVARAGRDILTGDQVQEADQTAIQWAQTILDQPAPQAGPPSLQPTGSKEDVMPALIGPRERREVPEDMEYFADSREHILASTEPYRQEMDRAFREAIERARKPVKKLEQ